MWTELRSSTSEVNTTTTEMFAVVDFALWSPSAGRHSEAPPTWSRPQELDFTTNSQLDEGQSSQSTSLEPEASLILSFMVLLVPERFPMFSWSSSSPGWREGRVVSFQVDLCET